MTVPRSDLDKQLAKARSKLDRIRRSAARNLGRFDDPRAREVLTAKLMIDPCLEVQAAAHGALAALGGDDATASLARAFHGDTFFALRGDGSPGQLDAIVRSAALALAGIGSPKAVGVLLDALAAFEPRGMVGAGWVGAGSDDMIRLPILRDALERCPRPVLHEAAAGHPSEFVRRYVGHAFPEGGWK